VDVTITHGQPGDNIPIAGVPNLRDMGGWAASGGRVRRGMLYRSAEFGALEGDAAGSFAKLGIRSVYDLRTADERTANPNTVPAGTEYTILDILADAQSAAPAMVGKALADPKMAAETLGDGKAVAMFEEGYRQIVGLPSALTGYRQFFTDISEPEHRPGAFHCTTGKDRTGWAAATFLLALGVSEEDVYADYLLTNEQLVPALKPLVDQFAAAGGDADLLTPVIGVQRSYLDAGLAEMRKRFKSIDGYFTDGLGLDAATIERLRSDFIEEAE
jgi:protein-tyrosine phosphatase